MGYIVGCDSVSGYVNCKSYEIKESLIHLNNVIESHNVESDIKLEKTMRYDPDWIRYQEKFGFVIEKLTFQVKNIKKIIVLNDSLIEAYALGHLFRSKEDALEIVNERESKRNAETKKANAEIKDGYACCLIKEIKNKMSSKNKLKGDVLDCVMNQFPVYLRDYNKTKFDELYNKIEDKVKPWWKWLI